MDKVIVTVLLIIGGVVAAFAILNGIYPALQRSSSAINSATDQVNDQIKSQIEIINVSSNESSVQVWVKNVGTSIISNIQNSDVFLTYAGSVSRLTYSDTSVDLPSWNYQLTGSSSIWSPTVTNQITIHLDSPLSPGQYQVKVIIPNGVSGEATFGE